MKKPILDFLLRAIETGEPVVLATIIRGAENEIGRHLLIRRDGSSQGDWDEATLMMLAPQQAMAWSSASLKRRCSSPS